MKRVPSQSTIYCASRNGIVHMAITLDDKFENMPREKVLEELSKYGKITGNYSWDPTNIGLDSPVDKALELIELYRQVDYISDIFVSREKIKPCS